MSEVSIILEAASDSDPSVADRLLPLIYDELRKLAKNKLASDAAAGSLQATALVHEAYVRLVQPDPEAKWNGRAHFFASAAEAMRRILVDRARQKKTQKRGGDRKREHLPEDAIEAPNPKHDLLGISEALERLQEQDPRKADLVKLRFFVGFSIPEAAEALGISPATADRDWAYAKAWLFGQLNENQGR